MIELDNCATVVCKGVEEENQLLSNPELFIQTICKIQHPIHGIIPFILRPTQTNAIRTFEANQLTIATGDRQVGKSAITMAYGFWHALSQPNRIIFIASTSIRQAESLLNMIRIMHKHLPDYIKLEILCNNKSEIRFENGSRIIAITPGCSGKATTPSLMILDDFAFVPTHKQRDFLECVMPMIDSTTTKCIMESSFNPSGAGIFSQMWASAGKHNNFVPILI
jgi:hypothetical protein